MHDIGFVGFGRVVVLKGCLTIGIEFFQSVKFRQCHRLYDREALFGPSLQVLLGFFAVESVK